jgi:metal-responsive CopG/Arc/MetJ family transcriptional regulator
MPNVKTAISLDEKLFDAAEAAARDLKVTRSRLFALALDEFLRRRRDERLTEAINAACADEDESADDQHLLRGIRRLQRRAGHDEW